jgi:glycosyltransferase involved in cell wall biosynthesis
MRPLRILHTDSSTGLGGQELRVLSEAVGMVRRGHAVVLAVPPDSDLQEYAKKHHVPVEPVSLKRRRYGALVFDFLKVIRKHGVQVVNTHGSLDSWTASVAGRLSRRKPIIIRTRHKSTPVANSLRHQILYRRLPHAIITTGEAVRAALMEEQGINESKIVSIPTGVDLSIYRPTPPDAKIRGDFDLSMQHVVVGTVAFLRDYKGLNYFVEAAKLVTRKHPEARFLIVGNGPEEMTLRRKIKELQLSERVTLTGFREDIPNILAAMDVFALSSVEGEGLPQALTQAMAMARPVVATAVGSVGEVVKDRVTGLLSVPRDPEGLAQNLSLLIENPALRDTLARAGRELIVQSYSVEHMLNRTEELYGQLLQTHGPGSQR